MKLLEPIFTLLGVEVPQHVAVLDATCFATLHCPSFPPDVSALIEGFVTHDNLTQVVQVLMSVYHHGQKAYLAWGINSSSARVAVLSLGCLLQSLPEDLPEWLYLPPLAPATSFESFQEVVAHLRAPDGCPWDREQTHRSLRPYLLEEAYEVLAALDSGDILALQEEFGDLLLQIVLHAQIAAEMGEFCMADILKAINDKLVYRHPHVFGEVQVDDVGNVLQNWEKLKAEERKAKGKGEKSLLASVPKTLPALVQALEYQKRAARVGFDWPNVEGILDKVHEESIEVQNAMSNTERATEIGDLLFSIVNLARFYHIDAESVLRETNVRFRQRFEFIERVAQQEDRSISELSLQEMDDIWKAAKREEQLVGKIQ